MLAAELIQSNLCHALGNITILQTFKFSTLLTWPKKTAFRLTLYVQYIRTPSNLKKNILL